MNIRYKVSAISNLRTLFKYLENQSLNYLFWLKSLFHGACNHSITKLELSTILKYTEIENHSANDNNFEVKTLKFVAIIIIEMSH